MKTTVYHVHKLDPETILTPRWIFVKQCSDLAEAENTYREQKTIARIIQLDMVTTEIMGGI